MRATGTSKKLEKILLLKHIRFSDLCFGFIAMTDYYPVIAASEC